MHSPESLSAECSCVAFVNNIICRDVRSRNGYGIQCGVTKIVSNLGPRALQRLSTLCAIPPKYHTFCCQLGSKRMFGCSLENGSGLRICGSLRLFGNVMRRTPTVDWKAALQREIRMQGMVGTTICAHPPKTRPMPWRCLLRSACIVL